MTERTVRAGGVVLAVWAGILLSLYGAFLTPYRIGSVLVPISLVLAAGGNFALTRFAYRLTARPWLSLLPGAAWVATTFAFSGRRPEGDVVLLGDNWVAQLYLFAGIIAITATGYLLITRPRPAPIGSPGSTQARASAPRRAL